MSPPLKALSPNEVDFSAFDEIIDVRTPSEFAEDKLPGAINLPVLSQEQHAEVGTLYKQVSPFDARKLGGALVSRNIADHLQQHFAEKPKDYRPLVYCWRGGQRSRAFATVLSQVGWQVSLVEGGYKAFRRHVRDFLAEPPKLDFRILTGLTGSGKTQALAAIERVGGQALDLEAMANHLGSLLGQMPNRSIMTQRHFESRLWFALSKLDPSQPVWVEGESGKIGPVFIPQPLFGILKAARSYRLETPLDLRVENTIALYPHWPNDPEGLIKLLSRLKARHGGQEIAHWIKLINSGRFPELVERLLSVHYDPSYTSPGHRIYREPEQTFQLHGLADEDFNSLAKSMMGEAGC